MTYELWFDPFDYINSTKGIDDLILGLKEAVAQLELYKSLGVKLDNEYSSYDEVVLITSDKSVAEYYGFDERDNWEDKDSLSCYD